MNAASVARWSRVRRGGAAVSGSRLEAARHSSPLPQHADIARAERVLRAARDEAARRWLARAPGPWGADAPRAPEATFDESSESRGESRKGDDD